LLSKYLSRQKARFGLLSALLLSGIGLQVVNPQIMRYFIDAATTGKHGKTLTIAAFAFIGIAVIQQVLSVTATYFGEVVAWTATNELRADLSEHCLHLDMGFHNGRSPGEMIERIEGDLSEFSDFFSQLVIRIFGNIVLLAGILIALYFTNIRLGLMFTLFACVTLLVLMAFRSFAVPHQKAFRDANTALFGFLEERLSGTEDIRSCGAVPFVLRGLFSLQRNIFKKWRKAQIAQIWVGTAANILLAVGYGIAFLGGYHLYRAGSITIGMAYLIVHYTGLFSRPIRELTMQVESMQNIGATVERMSELFETESNIPDKGTATIPSGRPLSLQFDGVSFSYNEDKQVLKDVSLHIDEGKVLGLLGRTGSGKTTLARLIFRLYDASEGTIRLDGRDILEYSLSNLRRRVAFVTQEVQLFQATVRDNITFFGKDTSDARIMEVIEALELGDWYAGLPNGLDTMLETGGRSLSAGEAQLLAFARVFLRDPGLVVLDEASSRLDPATEHMVERAIDKLLQNRTAIVIAHRLGTVERADDILVLDEGRVVEYGSRLRLLADEGSHFYQLRQVGLEELLA
jgi:ABC-type multidrug transport system fused ATPase/permease subunit